MSTFPESLRPIFSGMMVLGALSGWLAAGASTESGPITALPTEEIFVHAITPLEGAVIRNVSTIDWSARRNLLVFDKRGINQYYNIFSITPDGFRLSALTLDRSSGATRLHNTCPVWHPNGNFILFSGQNRGSTDYRRSGPGGGWHCNLWACSADGNQYWQLTDYLTRYNTPRGVTMPAISPNGKKVLWTGFTGDRAARTVRDQRALFLADLDIVRDTPSIKNEQMFQPGLRHDFYESYAFSPDGGSILFAGNLGKRQPWYCMDIYSIRRGEATPTALCPNETGWDRYAAYSPDGKKIAWSSSRTFNIPFIGQGGEGWQRYLRSELWIMDANGENPRQLTFFNTRGAKESNGRRAFVGDLAWSPDGTRLAIVLYRENRNFDVVSQIMFVTLGKGDPNKAEQKKAGAAAKKTPPRKKAPAKPKPSPAPLW